MSICEEPAALNREVAKSRNTNRSTVVCRDGMVCTSQPLASVAGLDVLKAGGNAVDAAVCANAVLSVVEPMSCGPGGDLFALVWSENDRKLYGLNASGRSPYAWDLDRARSLGLKSIPAHSVLSWSVPGCVDGWDALLRRFGALQPSQVFQGAISYARDGFPVSSIIAAHWPFELERHPSLASVFMPGGRGPGYGTIFKNPELAAFFEILVRDGLRSFYEGDIAERIVRFSEAYGGLFALNDFQDHRSTWVMPVGTSYRGFDVWQMPPNGQGICVLQMLNMLETFDIASLRPNSAEHLHLVVEAKKAAYEDRAVYYADMEKADVPVEALISKDYGRIRAHQIDPERASSDVRPGEPCRDDTIYLATADRHGNMVSLIQSIYHAWGSRFVPEGLGFALQNRGMAFSLDRDHRNCLEPHKRPFHTIIPGFVTRKGEPVFAFGVMGGDFQPQGQVQVLLNMLDFGMSPQQAGEQPRVAHTGSSTPEGTRADNSGKVLCEPGIERETCDRLSRMGHVVEPTREVFGGYQGIWREENPRRYFGGSDPRKDGCAVGW